MSIPLVIFGSHDIGELANYYFSNDTEYTVVAFTLDYAHSEDGHQWQRAGLSVPYALNVAQAFSRPSVCVDEHGYHMWFSYRSGTGERYRIGYAHSDDGVQWQLDLKNAGIDVSLDGWDADMIEYPYVFEHKNQRYMLYNGNGYGASGFGVAKWQI